MAVSINGAKLSVVVVEVLNKEPPRQNNDDWKIDFQSARVTAYSANGDASAGELTVDKLPDS